MTKAKKKGIMVRQVASQKKSELASVAVSGKLGNSVKKTKKVAIAKKSAEEKKKKVVNRKRHVARKTSNQVSQNLNLNTFNTDELVEKLMKNNELHKQAEEQRRKFMWVGVSIVMFLIVVIWGYNLQKSFVNNEIKNDGADALAENSWGDITADIANQLDEIKQGLDKIDGFKLEGKASISTTTETGLPVIESSDEVNQVANDESTIASTSEEVVE